MQDERQYRQIIREHGSHIMAFICRSIPVREDAEEIAEDVFVKAFSRLSTYDAKRGSMRNWLLGIACHEVLMFMRRRRPLTISLEPEARYQGITDEEADRLLAETHEQRIATLQNAIQMLKTEDQLLLQLYYTEQLPLKEIAVIAGHDHLYLATRLQRIRKKLCTMIKQTRRDEHE